MARDNQGLQIALIIFVVLAVVLGATTWFFYQKSTEMEKRAADEKEAATQSRQQAENAKDEAKEISKLVLGPTATGKLDEVQKQAEKDVLELGGGFKAGEWFYSPALRKLAGIKAERDAELKKKNEEIAKWEVKYKEREASKDPEIKKFQQGADAAAQELAAEKQKFDTRRADAEKQAADAVAKLADVRKKTTEEIDKQKEDLKKISQSLATTQGSLEKKTTVINNYKRTIVDVPDADIRWVNQRSGLVWINVGRADGLQPLMTFSVYPADISDLSKGARKGSVEVTQLLGDHMAEARITDDTITDPIMPGDKVDTSLWNPGEQLHFALAGLMDVNGDGRNDLELVKNLITMNNGVVDSYEDEKGHVHGLSEMSINTRFLVKGSEGKKDASIAAIVTGQTTMIDKAKELGVQTISLQELLQRMGYKSPVSTKATGDDNDANRFRPKTNTVEPRTKVPGQFQPRQPAETSEGI